jgi:hypothetical protein
MAEDIEKLDQKFIDNPNWIRPGEKRALGRASAHMKQRALLERAIFDAVTYDDMLKVFKKIKTMAIRGNINAIKILLERCLGKAVAHMEITTVEAGADIKQLSTEDLLRLAAGEN